MPTYSKDEVEAKLDEILRQVRAGERVVIALDGEDVAEIRPITKKTSLEEKLADLERRGILTPAVQPKRPLRALAHKPGALARFLRSRD